MVNTYRAITRSGFRDRLGLRNADLQARQGSHVIDARTNYCNGHGDILGYMTRTMCPITGEYEERYFIATPTDEPEEVHSTLWL